MSKKQQDMGDGQLPLPTPRSSRELDEKILAHARANAPAPRRSFALGWTGGMATTAVLVMAVYLTNTTESDKEAAVRTQAVLKEEVPMAGAALPVESRIMAKRKAVPSADFDVQESPSREPEALQMAPAAEMAASSERSEEVKLQDAAAPNIQETLEHLQTLLEHGEIEQARLGYAQLRNACSECGLPDTLEQALKGLQR